VDRWFVTGMAASFVDPLFSSNTMTIAALNVLIGERHRSGSHGEERHRSDPGRPFQRVLPRIHEANLRAMDYRGHGSFDGWSPFRMAMLNNIINRAMPEYYQDLRDLIAFADRNVGRLALADEQLARMIDTASPAPRVVSRTE
jgi:hypothetical protein